MTVVATMQGSNNSSKSTEMTQGKRLWHLYLIFIADFRQEMVHKI